jgi:inositol phosphorylceramide mannosyltransferase catalytic subunit
LAASVIPRVVHRLWLGPEPMPARYHDYADRWRELGYEVRDWTEAIIPAIRNRAVLDAIAANPDATGIHRQPVAVQWADVLSYELVWRLGGIYANCDIEPHKDLHELLDGVEAFVVAEDHRFLSNALFGARHSHLFFDAVISTLPGHYGRTAGRPMNEQTGPYLLTDVWERNPDLVTRLEPVPFFPYGYWAVGEEGQPHDCWVEHHWGHKLG